MGDVGGDGHEQHVPSAAAVFNQDISSWVVSAVANFNSMFNGAIAFNKGFTMTTSWTGAGGASATNMFQGATAWLLRYDPPTAGSVDGPASAWSVKLCASERVRVFERVRGVPRWDLAQRGR